MADIEKIIREEWFKDHIATLTQEGNLQVLNWRRPNSVMYSCRYVFDGNMMYISGDIGTAVFWLTWKADVHSFNDLHVGYFHSKINAFSDEKYDFNSDEAVKRLREWLKELKRQGESYDQYEMQMLFEKARGCDSNSDWAEIINDSVDFIKKLDRDYWEWIYKIGQEIPRRVYAYLIGLQMASEQLRRADSERD